MSNTKYNVIMIRLNAFFELKDAADAAEVKVLGKELVEKSRQDEGNVYYDLFQSATEPARFVFCETWQDDAALAIHSNAEHFTRLVPQISAYTKNGLEADKFKLDE